MVSGREIISKLKIKMVFQDWQYKGLSINGRPEWHELSMGRFVPGNEFEGEVSFKMKCDMKEFKRAMSRGFNPVFYCEFEKMKKRVYKGKK